MVNRVRSENVTRVRHGVGRDARAVGLCGLDEHPATADQGDQQRNGDRRRSEHGLERSDCFHRRVSFSLKTAFNIEQCGFR
jgi:hypothetical protein